MNIIKKIGLTALAGSLVATSVFAGTMDVTGSAGISFAGQEKSSTGNGFSSGDSINFSGSTELDNGFTITANMELDGGAQATTTQLYDDRSIVIGMGDSGTLTFWGHGGSSALGAVDDVMPTAYGETWDILGASTQASAALELNALSSGSSENMFVYSNSMIDGVSFTASYTPSGAAEAESSLDYAVAYTGVEGLTVGAAMGEDNAVAGTGSFDSTTMYVKYAYGPVTVGIQTSEVTGNTAANSDEMDIAGITYAVSDSLSVGYGMSVIDLGDSTSDQETSSVNFSYTMGGMTLAGAFVDQDNTGGVAAAVNDRSGYAIDLSFAF